MTTATQEKIKLLDNVRVAPTENSSIDAQHYGGRIGTVYHKTGDSLAVVFENGVRLCLSADEVVRVESVADRMMNRSTERHWFARTTA